jgi:tetratricopeptide (TPR) repeat protein
LNYSYRREHSRAVQELGQALERFPRSATPHLGLAWLLATCPEPAYRNGAEAVAEGLHGCEVSYWSDWGAVDVLAAAYAEHGDFDRAIEFAKLAQSLPGLSPRDRDLLEDRLSLYEDRIAVRDMGVSRGSGNPTDEGLSAYARGDYERALRCFNAVLPPNADELLSAVFFPFPYDTEEKMRGVPWAVSEGRALTNAFFYRGLAYQRKNQWDKAIADFTTVIHHEPEATAARRERGVTYTMKGETDRGLRDFDEVIRLKPDDALAYVLRANALQLTKQWDAAIEAATTAIKLDARLAAAYHIRGRAYIGKKEYGKAARDFSELDRLDPNDPQSAHDRAKLFNAKGDYKSALTELREMVRRFPRFAYGRNALAWFLATCPNATYRSGAEAVEHAQSACELSQWKDAYVIDTLAAAYAEAGDFDHAIKYATQAVNLLSPSDTHEKEIKERLALFQRKEAYHANPPEQQR